MGMTSPIVTPSKFREMAMFKDNALLAQLKQNIQQDLPRVEGKVKATDKSYGFLETDKGKSYFITPPQMKKVMHGDIVEAVIVTDKGKEQAEPKKLVLPALTRFIARIASKKNKLVLTPPAPYKGAPIAASLVKNITANDSDYVLASLANHPLKEPAATSGNSAPFSAQIEQLVASADDQNTPWLVTLAKHNLQGASLAITSPNNQTTCSLQEPDLNREDLTSALFFTIDGESTRDMDDAISISQTSNGDWRLQVAIADPAAYISHGSDIDIEAKSRGYTHYLPGQTITMLPESLSDDLCSLREGEKRAVIICTIHINARGKMLNDGQFSFAWIKSSAKLSYQQVSDFINKCGQWQAPAPLAQALNDLNALALARSFWRAKNTQLFDQQPDYRLRLDDNQRLESVDVQHHTIAHNMVEESMLLANFCGGALLSKYCNNGIFNTHPGFDPEKVAKLSVLLREHGYIYSKEHLLTTVGFCQLQRELTSRSDNYFAARLRKFQNYANISHVPQPHHGLGVEQYATWTSPIRKYGDLLNHRLIKSIIDESYNSIEIDAMQAELLKEQRDYQRQVERDINNWLYIDYLQQDIDNATEFDATVFNINRGGLMAKIANNGAVIFIPLSNIHANKKACKIDTELGTISVDEQVKVQLNDPIKLVITSSNKDKLNLTGKMISDS